MNCNYCGTKLKHEPNMTELWWYCPNCEIPYFIDDSSNDTMIYKENEPKGF